MKDWKARAIACDEAIVKNDYYVDIWKTCKPPIPFDQCTKFEALNAFQDFWEKLPDRAAIRRPPFADVCDLAEEACFGEPEVGDGRS